MFKKGKSLIINCTSTDLDVIEKLVRTVGYGNITQNKQIEGHKTAYTWRIGLRSAVMDIIVRIRPHMGERRGQRIDEMIQFNEEHPTIR